MLTQQTEKMIVQPSAARMVESLRDTGYTFTTSVADIIDNSVSAEADNIAIKLNVEFGNTPVLWIADNGSGMDERMLVNAMAYGSPKRPDPKSLGKFGMGLKTASTSFCRKLTVISRKDKQLNIRQWNLDVIIKEDDWSLLKPEEKYYAEAIEFLDSVSDKGNGTVVIWETIDRLVRTNAEGTLKAQINHLVDELKQHISGVFYNFLTKGGPYPDITISVNGENVEPWDPFCRWMNTDQEKRVEVHENTPFKYIKDDELLGIFYVNIYIIPEKNSLTSEEINKVRYGLDNQGFHVFREGRMISSGGWPNRLFVKDPHQNLLRVEFLFDHKLDDIFQIDIKKSRIDFPKELRDQLKRVIAPARNEADRIYRLKNPRKKASEGASIHDQSSNAIGKHLEENTSGSEVAATDTAKGEATVRNKFGKATIKLKFDESSDLVVQPSNTLQDGVLWLPGLIDGNKHAVFLNESHEFYKRFYLANQHNTALILAMDSLLWSMAEAELCVYSDNIKRNLEDFRISVSRSLRTLSEELPEFEDSENDEATESNS